MALSFSLLLSFALSFCFLWLRLCFCRCVCVCFFPPLLPPPKNSPLHAPTHSSMLVLVSESEKTPAVDVKQSWAMLCLQCRCLLSLCRGPLESRLTQSKSVDNSLRPTRYDQRHDSCSPAHESLASLSSSTAGRSETEILQSPASGLICKF